MARELQATQTIVIIGDATAPLHCISDYCVVNADMQEPSKLHEEAAPNFNQAVSALATGCVDAIKAAEGL